MTGRDRDIQKWIDLSEYDLATAEAMLASKRYLYVLFCCQQSVEKKLKGLIVRATGAFPPRTHDLLRLATLSGVVLDGAREAFLRRLTNYYIGTRYPEEVSDLARDVDKVLARTYLDETKEMLRWLDHSKRQPR
jgi:HEPN domain-containing protein